MEEELPHQGEYVTEGTVEEALLIKQRRDMNPWRLHHLAKTWITGDPILKHGEMHATPTVYPIRKTWTARAARVTKPFGKIPRYNIPAMQL